MDTKWKNMKKIWEMRKNSKGRMALTLLFGLPGVWLLFLLWLDRHDWPSESAWVLGGIINLFLGAALYNGIRRELEKRYQEWNSYVEEFYQKWQMEWKKQQKRVIGIAIACTVVVLLLFREILNPGWGGYYYTNYSVGYVLVGTVLIQFMIAEATVICYMYRMLHYHVADMEAIVQKKVQEAMETTIRSERMKVDLISNVSHDLKTPLTSMVGYIELLKKEELSDVVSDYVEVLGNKAQKLKEMIDSLFDLAKTSSGNIMLNMEKLELNRLIEQVQADMEDKFREADREVVIELTEEATEFTSDSSYMYRICQNLMENALKYSADHTRIFFKTARVRQNGREMLQFEVTNTANYRMNFTKEQIVERFARGDEARTTDGNGLGLAIVSTYTSALGGIFEVNIDCDQFKATVAFPVSPQENQTGKI